MDFHFLKKPAPKTWGHPLPLSEAPIRGRELYGQEVTTQLPTLSKKELLQKADEIRDRFISLAGLDVPTVLRPTVKYSEGSITDRRVHTLARFFAWRELNKHFHGSIPEFPTATLNINSVAAGAFSVCGQRHIGYGMARARAQMKLEQFLGTIQNNFAASLKDDFASVFRLEEGAEPLLVGVVSDGSSTGEFSNLGAQWLSHKAALSVGENFAKSPRLLSREFLGGVLGDLVMEIYRIFERVGTQGLNPLSGFLSCTLEVWVQTKREALRFHLSDGYGAVHGRFQEHLSHQKHHAYLGYLPLFGFGLGTRKDHTKPINPDAVLKDYEGDTAREIFDSYRYSLAFKIGEYLSSAKMEPGIEYGFATDGLEFWNTKLSPLPRSIDFPADRFFHHYRKEHLAKAVFLWNLAGSGKESRDPYSSDGCMRPYGLIGPLSYLIFKDMREFSLIVQDALKFSPRSWPLPLWRKYLTHVEAVEGLGLLQQFFDGVTSTSPDSDKQRLLLVLERLRGLALNSLSQNFPAVPWPSGGRGVLDDCSVVSIRRV